MLSPPEILTILYDIIDDKQNCINQKKYFRKHKKFAEDCELKFIYINYYDDYDDYYYTFDYDKTFDKLFILFPKMIKYKKEFFNNYKYDYYLYDSFYGKINSIIAFTLCAYFSSIDRFYMDTFIERKYNNINNINDTYYIFMPFLNYNYNIFNYHITLYRIIGIIILSYYDNNLINSLLKYDDEIFKKCEDFIISRELYPLIPSVLNVKAVCKN